MNLKSLNSLEQGSQALGPRDTYGTYRKFFHKAKKNADAAVEAGYMVSELIVKSQKPFTEGPFLKKCILLAADIFCPEKKSLFSNVALSAKTVAEYICNLSGDIYEQLCDKAQMFTAYSVAHDESTDITGSAQLAIFIRKINDQSEVTEKLLDVYAW